MCCGEAGNEVDPTDWENYVLLLREIRAAMDLEWPNSHKELTIAMGLGAEVTGPAPKAELGQILDFVNLMAYDLNGAWSNLTGHNAPLVADPAYEAAGGSATANIDWGVKEWLGAVPGSKLVLGMPAYGRGWAGTATEYGTATGPAAGTWEPGVFSYWDLAENYIDKGYTRSWNTLSSVPYLTRTDSGSLRFISYDDPQSIAIKAAYGRDLGLAGLMWWEASDDKDGELVKAANDAWANAAAPTAVPSTSPSTSMAPSVAPTTLPSAAPTASDYVAPSATPSVSMAPSASPSSHPSTSLSTAPSASPSVTASAAPSTSLSASAAPSASPSAKTCVGNPVGFCGTDWADVAAGTAECVPCATDDDCSGRPLGCQTAVWCITSVLCGDQSVPKCTGECEDGQPASTPDPVDTPDPMDTPDPIVDQRVVAYYAQWAIYGRNFFPWEMQLDAITHVHYAFFDVDSNCAVHTPLASACPLLCIPHMLLRNRRSASYPQLPTSPWLATQPDARPPGVYPSRMISGSVLRCLRRL